MKIYHTMLWTLVLLCINVHANTISKTDALQKAKSFLSAKDNKASVETYSILGKAEMYKVVTDEGWCLLSSEKSVKPVLAYSTIDNFPSDEEMPEGMKWLFSLYEEIIAYAKEHAEEDGGRNIWETDDNQYNSPLSNRTETVYLSRLGTKIKAGAKFYATVDMAYSFIYPHFIIAATSNSQINDSQNEATKQLLGTWQVYRERVTGIMWGDEGMPYTGSYTHDVNTQMHYMFTPDYEYEIYLDEASEVVYYSDNRPYTIEPQAGDTWLLTISGAFDMPKPSDSAISGRSPITIYKLTENEMEWEYTYYGGDEGPVTYYQYVRRYISNEQGTENVSSSSSVRKILCNSQILILRGEKVYTLTGAEVK